MIEYIRSGVATGIACALLSACEPRPLEDTTVRSVTAERDGLRAEVTALRADLAAAQREAARVPVLESENSTLKRQLEELTQRVAELEGSDRLSQRPGGNLARTPQPGGEPPSPEPTQDAESLRRQLQGGSGSK